MGEKEAAAKLLLFAKSSFFDDSHNFQQAMKCTLWFALKIRHSHATWRKK